MKLRDLFESETPPPIVVALQHLLRQGRMIKVHAYHRGDYHDGTIMDVGWEPDWDHIEVYFLIVDAHGRVYNDGFTKLEDLDKLDLSEQPDGSWQLHLAG